MSTQKILENPVLFKGKKVNTYCLKIFTFTFGIITLCSRGMSTPSARSERISRNEVVIGLSSVPEHLDPRKMLIAHHLKMAPLVFENLVNRSTDGKYFAGLAKTWEFSNNGHTVLFNLEKHDQKESQVISAFDVAKCISSHFWKGSTSIMKVFLAPLLESGIQDIEPGQILSSIKVISPQRLVINLKKAQPNILDVLSMHGFAIIPSVETNNFHSPRGTGPMTGKFNQANHTWTFERKFDSNKQIPRTIIFKEIKQDLATGIANFDELDVIIDPIYPDLISEKFNDAFIRNEIQTFQYSHLFFNTTRGKCFKQIQNRLTLSGIVHSTRDLIASRSFVPLNTYLPFGVMSPSYYKKDRIPIPNQQSIRNLRRCANDERPRIVLVREYLPKGFPSLLLSQFKALDLRIDVQTIRKFEQPKLIKSQQYNVASRSYLGSEANPKSFLNPLFNGSNFQYLKLPKKLNNRFRDSLLNNELGNSSKFLEAIEAFENENLIIPMYHVRPAIYTHSGISFEFNKYNYEYDYSSFTWKQGKN